ncbi:pyridoxal-dependent decarboxylase [Arsenophonus nasoniae]|uniref:Pyridoxal-dependent decarboxylase n=1 Tax=Arsenophonus nasoniae TaxID=638 RepID=A0AA95GUJ0_9GAMM|nr:pyridoxal-dependent decarboxylase [Arsenophonus nasoniae]WGM03134.1 pyridoxal-dependent decarboxylase [Arsenophonus nasoniae]
MTEAAKFFEGSIQVGSKKSLFNMIPQPSPEATAAAAAWAATYFNVNSLMDAFGGKSLLVEQQVSRTIGRWVGWHDAMGISCSGGKITILYALKSAISRLCPASIRDGLPNNLVILCSEGAHYCVEHVASMIEIGATNCWRLKSDDEGKTTAGSLKLALETALNKGKKIAAIICCGGTTINFNCEDTVTIHTVIDQFIAENKLNYRPYLHLDSVIGWLFFSLMNQSKDQLTTKINNDTIAKKFQIVLKRFQALDKFDSFGVDFHKNGLCPYSSSFFISKDCRFMDDLGDGSYRYSKQDFQYGNLRAYRYTLENSRSSHGILSSWVNLKSKGRLGMGAYPISLYQSRFNLEKKMQTISRLSVLNGKTLGWEIVFDINFSTHIVNIFGDQHKTKTNFIIYCWEISNLGYDIPFFSIVPNYRINNQRDRVTTGFLFYPMKLLSEDEWLDILGQLELLINKFEYKSQQEQQNIAQKTTKFEAPIR